ncbi:hypothetical protein [Burkholderia sp. WSM2230]|uniref:hypothetical protein n=1 Tax=Burkholderia sp. WSM2230 TaxID=944435 RepID=UPI000407107D|nr:hypothetical protein [Burkholderia sp. WSM2230]
MKILSHRGYWLQKSEKNTDTAFHRSFDLGFGTETDLRDRLGEIVISHDPANSESKAFDDYVSLLGDRNLTQAFNIKADGLAEPLHAALAGKQLDWFVFDMSIPDMRMHIKAGNPVFARMSEVERDIPWSDAVSGVWLDAFDANWYSASTIANLLGRGLRVCVVSPELHGREHLGLWESLRGFVNDDRVLICTDFPEDCRRFYSQAFPNQ